MSAGSAKPEEKPPVKDFAAEITAAIRTSLTGGSLRGDHGTRALLVHAYACWLCSTDSRAAQPCARPDRKALTDLVERFAALPIEKKVDIVAGAVEPVPEVVPEKKEGISLFKDKDKDKEKDKEKEKSHQAVAASVIS